MPINKIQTYESSEQLIYRANSHKFSYLIVAISILMLGSLFCPVLLNRTQGQRSSTTRSAPLPGAQQITPQQLEQYESSRQATNDHDDITTLKTKVDTIAGDVREIKNGQKSQNESTRNFWLGLAATVIANVIGNVSVVIFAKKGVRK